MSFQRFLAVAVFMATTVLSTPLERRAALPILLSNDDGCTPDPLPWRLEVAIDEWLYHRGRGEHPRAL